MKNKFISPAIISLLFIPVFVSCTSLPKATVNMSILLDGQLTLLEQNHITIINKYFEEKQYHIVTFLDNEWYPKYLDSFFEKEEAEDIWNEIINNPNKKERIADLQIVVSVIQEEYMAMRESLLSPLESTRRELLTAVQNEYNTAKTMNNAILNNIRSVNEVQEARKEYFAKVVDIDGIDSIINSYLKKADNILNDAKERMDNL